MGQPGENEDGRVDISDYIDIAHIYQRGFEVFDDNDPALENIPANSDAPPPPINEGLYEGQSWGWDDIDCHITMGGRTLLSHHFQITPQGKSFLDLFIYFFLMIWFMTVLLVKTDEAVQVSGANPPITFVKHI